MNQPQLAQDSRRRRGRRLASESERTTARVTVAWVPSSHCGVPGLAPTEIELVAGFDADPNRTWTCPEIFGSNWVEAISSARCNEVVLTARLGNDLAARHSVLELAELLTLRLTESHPLIRVLFVPAASTPRGNRSHA